MKLNNLVELPGYGNALLNGYEPYEFCFNNITWIITAKDTNKGFQVKKSILIWIEVWLFFLKKASIMSRQDKRIIHPNKNRGNNSPPAGKSILSKPKNIAKQMNKDEVK